MHYTICSTLIPTLGRSESHVQMEGKVMKNLKSISVLAASFHLISCGSTEEQNKSSDVKHLFGYTREFRPSAMEDCNPNEVNQVSTQFAPVTTQYLKNMMLDMMERNNASGAKTFTGFLRPSDFCIGTEFSKIFNAYAIPVSGQVVFNSQVLLEAQNDAFVAGILAHELAHITLKHDTWYPEHTFRFARSQAKSEFEAAEKATNENNKRFSDSIPKLLEIVSDEALGQDGELDALLENLEVRTPEYWATIGQFVLDKGLCAEKCAEWSSAIDETVSAITAFNTSKSELDSIVARYYNEEDIANKTEKDADEVGFEFFARSDYNLNSYFDFTTYFLENFDNKSLRSCTRRSLEEVSRGTHSHPENCWRQLNQREELKDHAEDYIVFQRESSINRFTSPSLAEVKAELQAIHAIIDQQQQAQQQAGR